MTSSELAKRRSKRDVAIDAWRVLPAHDKRRVLRILEYQATTLDRALHHFDAADIRKAIAVLREVARG